jgi:hypothetical protein
MAGSLEQLILPIWLWHNFHVIDFERSPRESQESGKGRNGLVDVCRNRQIAREHTLLIRTPIQLKSMMVRV